MIEWDPDNSIDPKKISDTSNFKVGWICVVCEFKWNAVIAARTSRCTGCPKCNRSIMEKHIGQLLETMLCETTDNWSIGSVCHNARQIVSPLELDVYIRLILPNATCHYVAIEMDGIQHFEPVKIFGGEDKLKITQERDIRKNKECEEKHIHLLRIGYDINKDKYKELLVLFFDKVAKDPGTWHNDSFGIFYNKN